jgi:uncharacterized membrane protein YecN with MAPEG domain
MPVPITALYTAVLALILTVLGFQVGSVRSRTGISILHGDNMELAERIRRHANFVENVPMALLLLGLIELNGATPVMLHSLGVALVVARILHPIGLHHDNMRHPLRGLGAFGTILVILIASGVAIWQFVGA